MANLAKIVEELSSLTVMQAAELSKMLEETWGVSAAAPVAQVMAAPAGEVKEAQTEFSVILTACGENKINVIKEIRVITNLGLAEAKKASEELPKVLKEGVSSEEANKLKAQIEAASPGAKVEVK